MSDGRELTINQQKITTPRTEINRTIKVGWQMFWDFWKSIKLSVTLFSVLIVACIIGTLIPQNVEQQVYTDKYGIGMAYLFHTIGLTNVYHCGWFTLLLIMLGVSTSVCATYRLKVVRRFMRQPAVIMDDHFYMHADTGIKLYTSMPLAESLKSTRHELQKHHFHVYEKKNGDGTYLYGSSGMTNQWGNLLIHFSVIVIMVGTLFGNTRISQFLSSYFVNGPLKGITSSVDGQYAFSTNMQINEGETQQVPHSGFQIRLNKFEVDFQKDGSMPKDFRSFVTVLENGKEISNPLIRVNQPLKYEGVKFFQSSYGQGQSLNRISLRIVDPANNQEIAKVGAQIGELMAIPGRPESFKIAQFLPDFALDPQMKPFSKSNEMNNPAFRLEEYSNGQMTQSTWIFPKISDFHAGKKTTYTYVVDSLEPSYFSVFQVVKDPGVPIVYLGFASLIFGTMLSLFRDHKRVWIKISANEKGSLIRMTGHANRRTDNRVPELDMIEETLKQLSKGKEQQYA